MMSRSMAVGLLAAGCLSAAAGGAFLRVQHRDPAVTVSASEPAAAPVAETEALVEPTTGRAMPAPAPAVRIEERVIPVEPTQAPVESTPAPAARAARASRRPIPQVAEAARAPQTREVAAPVVAPPAAERVARPAVAAVEELPTPAPAPKAPAPKHDEVVLPASSVIGLEIETTLTSERALAEDRVDARVARDVYADGRLVIPAGARALGSVTEVDRGGKVKDRARLGVTFHTLVLADGRQLELRTDTIYRDGDSPANGSSRKIGGAAIGGAVLGAITGGKKGAVIGGIAGAAGGTAVVMTGDRKAATLAGGTTVNARLASPLTVEVEHR